jgi:translation initiation factor 2 subunit 3
MENQPLINIGMIGHVSDGKSTLTKCLTQVQTQKFSKEIESNITMRLGYANARIYKCPNCISPSCYYGVGTNLKDSTCKHCNTQGELMNHVSFVDCPGHNSFMGTMLNGTSVMDYTITVESAVNKTFPAPQTIQHLSAVEYNNIQNIGMILNKIDLVSEITTIDKVDELKKFLQNYTCKNVPIIPMSASFDINVDVVCEMLAYLKVPQRELESSKLRMNIIRSFNINLPGTSIENLKGGVVGGSIVKGTINLNDEIYIYPGMIYENSYQPLKAKVITIFSEKKSLESAVPGGLIAIGLDIDPGLTGDDALVGNVIKKTNTDIGFVTKDLDLKVNFFEGFNDKIFNNESSKQIILNVNTNNIQGEIIENKENDVFNFVLQKPIYIEKDDKITVSIKLHEGLQVVGTGHFISCKNINLA